MQDAKAKFSLKTKLGLFAAVFLLGGCASTSHYISSSSTREIEQEILETDTELQLDATKNKGARPRIPVEINENVSKWINYFTDKDRERFGRFLKRGNQYKKLVQDILKEHGVPSELYYLAMIESGYSLHAKSHASAVGAWQFIRETGRRYGLKQDYYIDERRDIIRATHASARYLKNLHTVFQSWYLAMAGYNAGERRILNAIMAGGSRNFWELVEKKALPPETRNYVPKFLAAVIIGKHPEKYGFTNLTADEFPEVESITVPGGVSLIHIAKKIGISVAELKRINPNLMRAQTPGNRKNYSLWVPEKKTNILAAAYDELARKRIKATRKIASGARYHTVRKGEFLLSIAKKYKTNIRTIKKINGLRSNKIFPGTRLKLGNMQAVVKKKRKKVFHYVRRGDALISISAKYGVPVKRIKSMNELNSSKIYVGQKLVISQYAIN